MATSKHGRYVEMFPDFLGYSEHLSPEFFVDTSTTQTTLNNLNHIADQFGQVRVAWTASQPHFTGAHVLSGFFSAMSPLNEHLHVYTTPAFDLHVRSDGSSYPMRVALRMGSNHASLGVGARVALCPVGQSSIATRFGAPAAAPAVTVTGESADWYETDLIWLPPDLVQAARRAVQNSDTPSSVADAPINVTLLRVQLTVWVSIAAQSSPTPVVQGQLRGLYAAEYIPPAT